MLRERIRFASHERMAPPQVVGGIGQIALASQADRGGGTGAVRLALPLLLRREGGARRRASRPPERCGETAPAPRKAHGGPGPDLPAGGEHVARGLRPVPALRRPEVIIARGGQAGRRPLGGTVTKGAVSRLAST